jgi:hypothetical protein
LLRQKKFPEAQQEFLVALRLKRDWPDVYVDLAFAASENKNYELTVRALNGRALLNAEMPRSVFFFALPLMTTCATTNTPPSIIITFWIPTTGRIPIRSGRLPTA